MLVCPACGADDLIEGVDQCDHCEQPLTDQFIRLPNSSLEADLLRDRVRDLPAHEPLVLGPDATVGEALKKMVAGGVGCLLIVVDKALVGIFSERDALLRLGVQGVDLHDKPVVKYMTPNPAVVSGGDKIAYALQRMDVGGYRHLPVMEGDRPVNVISIRDILRYVTEHDRTATV
ncbi:CBS domain protein [Botrimarina colliarenosi]|uniref:CBS domain protein n=1 Tax=Botrimarina colliarenosi TaxID=2528001 RepID=A0A5C6AME6_9BACT|nr:CBS domain-containing protein [Botrimarina colliarenosi]TWT99343.1 CBS domain protein [Botrimarina colliarenosi]